MCGIAGAVGGTLEADERRSAVEKMVRALHHRGPDDEGIVELGILTLGMRRLSIFDPEKGRQPMSTADGRFHLVFNGAIYNHAQLREELEGKGHCFRSTCDTEVLLASFAQWGADCLPRLRGMFAFAIWDRLHDELFAARDPFGIKPFYYARGTAGCFLFASELSALLGSGLVHDALDGDAVGDSLAYLAVPAPRTLYRDIRSLRPGECLRWRHQETQVQSYWTFRDAAASTEKPSRTREEFVAELRQRLEGSIRAHSLADVPVGAFLSGGLDSAAIVALMRQATGNPVKTFSIGFEEAGYSEATEAAQMAQQLGADHHALVLTGKRVAGDIETLLAALDQPTGDALNTYYVSQLARAGGVKVALSGLGGDELFGGYSWFRTTPRIGRLLPWWRLLPSRVRAAFATPLRKGDARAQKLADLLTRTETVHDLAALQRRTFAEESRAALLLNPGTYRPHPEREHLPAELGDADGFSIVSAWELRTYMADVLLRDSDVMSMRHSLELRVPFVDRPLVEWLWKQPSRFKQQGNPKSALLDSVGDLLPPEMATRRKRGFTLPLALWMRTDLRPFLEHVFSTSSISRTGLFNTRAVQARWHAFLAGRDPREWSRVWTLGMLIAFLNHRRGGTG